MVHVENYSCIHSEVNFHYKLQGIIRGIINPLSILSKVDSFNLFSIEDVFLLVLDSVVLRLSHPNLQANL